MARSEEGYGAHHPQRDNAVIYGEDLSGQNRLFANRRGSCGLAARVRDSDDVDASMHCSVGRWAAVDVPVIVW